ncbi:MAG TPA: SDR family NAD(P)-dependent oxidoreductase [Candidatus Limnocylindria bacterium]|nr:SDR family NAD(P)-dependent oxidoreductase [Candidatus Limnocylindria bacterium]
MRELAGKVAVVTGAASGIGRALAETFAGAGMKVVLADVEAAALDVAARELGAAGADVLAVPTDVSSADAVEALAARTYDRFGAAHVVCNNAGVALAGPLWECTIDDWRWLLGVNLWGVIHGVRSFVPRMLAAATPGHVVNTASIAGLTSAPGIGAYNASKHAVVALSETLAKDLALAGAPIKVSVLCPGFVNTRILDSARNRPASLGAERPRPAEMESVMRSLVAAGMPPREVARHVLRAVEDERFYVLTHPDFTAQVKERCRDIVEGRTPSAEAITLVPPSS